MASFSGCSSRLAFADVPAAPKLKYTCPIWVTASRKPGSRHADAGTEERRPTTEQKRVNLDS